VWVVGGLRTGEKGWRYYAAASRDELVACWRSVSQVPNSSATGTRKTAVHAFRPSSPVALLRPRSKSTRSGGNATLLGLGADHVSAANNHRRWDSRCARFRWSPVTYSTVGRAGRDGCHQTRRMMRIWHRLRDRSPLELVFPSCSVMTLQGRGGIPMMPRAATRSLPTTSQGRPIRPRHDYRTLHGADHLALLVGSRPWSRSCGVRLRLQPVATARVRQLASPKANLTSSLSFRSRSGSRRGDTRDPG